MNEPLANFSHQIELFDPKCARKTILIGAGSVISWTALFLAKMGVTDIEAYDSDVVASHNTPMSFFAPRDVGRLKVEALREKVLRETGVEIKIHREMYTGQRRFRNCSVVAGVDQMETGRKVILQNVRDNPSVDIYLDSRIAVCYAELYAVNPNLKQDITRYEATLFTDGEGVRQTCGSHGIVFAAGYVGITIASTLALFWQTGQKQWRIQYQCDMIRQVL